MSDALNKKETGATEQLPPAVSNRKKPKAPPPIEQVYRQVYDLLDSKMVGFEAQTRINDRELGTLLPSLYVPIAERSNQIVELGKWSFVEMSDMIRRQREKGRSIGCMFMPVSVKYLCKRYFLDNLTRQMEKANMQPAEVCVLVDAASLADKPEGLSEAFAAVRERGIKIAVTGIGDTGFSLLHLNELAPDYLRFDATFTAQLVSDERVKDIANSFSELATQLGATLIADGVDTKEQAEALIEVGCSLMQGAYFSDYERESQLF